jgi:hypothetical protein
MTRSSDAPRSPYKFLDSYEPEDRDIFFGRSGETEILLADVVVSRLVVLFARTGTGKTSLINAGVRPLLGDRGYETFFVRVREDPVESLRSAIGDDPAIGPLAPGTLAEQLQAVASKLRRPIVVFFDQFEEFFLYLVRRRLSDAQQFVSDVAELMDDESSGVHIVFSMREEFFADMDIFRDEIPTIFHNDSNLRLRWFEREQAREAIIKPAGAVELEPALQERLLDDLTAIQDGVERIEPAQLQIVCDTLWRRQVDGRIGLDQYVELGGDGAESIPAEILKLRLEDEFRKLAAAELDLLERLLPLLRTRRGTKYLRDFDTLQSSLSADPAVLHALIDQLERSRIVRKDKRGDLLFVELAHDYLVDRLDELRDRVSEIVPRRALRAAMHDEAGLFSLSAFDSVLARLPKLLLSGEELEFLVRSGLEQGRLPRPLADRAVAAGIDLAGPVEARLSSPDDADAVAAVQLVAELPPATAVALLAKALERASLVPRVLEVAGRIASIEVVELLERASDRPGAQLPALLRALVKLAAAGSEDVAARAASAAVGAAGKGLAEGALTPSEVRLLARVESSKSVALLAETLGVPALQEVAEEALAQLSRRRMAPPEITRAAADALTAFLSGRELAAEDVEVLGAVNSVSSVELLERLGDAPHLGDAATDALTRLGRSPDPDVATRAEQSGLTSPGRPPELAADLGPEQEAHLRVLAHAFLTGRVVPLLGDRANPIGRPERDDWRRAVHAPTRDELARHLAEAFRYPVEHSTTLASVAQFAEVVGGRGWLYDELRAVYAADFAPNPLHHFLARLPAALRTAGVEGRYPIIVTLNYDTSLERAFEAAGEEVDVVSYLADGDDAGHFLHQPPADPAVVIERANEYTALSLRDRTTILKPLGGVNREDPDRDSFLVSEDDAIRQLTRSGLEYLLPVTLAAALRRSHVLCLGCSLADWVSRAVFERLLMQERLRRTSWAIGAGADPLEARYWQARGIDVIDVALERYVEALAATLDESRRT